VAQGRGAELPQLERALRVLNLLSAQGAWFTAEDLRRSLQEDCCVRTVKRTLEHIEAAHITLEWRRGAHGRQEVRLPSAFRVPPDLLSTDEALAALLLAKFSVHFVGSRMGQVVAGVMEKLEQLLPSGGILAESGLEEPKDALLVRQPGEVRGLRDGLLLSCLNSILERRECRAEYRRLGAQEARCFEVHPHSIIFHGGAIYLLVWQPRHENWLHLPLHRLDALEIGPTVFSRQPNFHLQDFLNGSFGIWLAQPVDLLLRFHAKVADYLQERQWHPTQQLEPQADGSLLLRMRVGLSPELRAWVLRWGELVEVLEPGEFRLEMGDTLRKAAAVYSSPSEC